MLEPGLRLTICGIDELAGHSTGQVTHVLSILDPGYQEPEAFAAYDPHHRLTLRFHDIIGPWPGWQAPERENVEALVGFGQELDGAGDKLSHLLVHCHAGISRSTAAMATLLARHTPLGEEDSIFARIREIDRSPGPTRAWWILPTTFSGGRTPQRRAARPLPLPGATAARVCRGAAPQRSGCRGARVAAGQVRLG